MSATYNVAHQSRVILRPLFQTDITCPASSMLTVLLTLTDLHLLQETNASCISEQISLQVTTPRASSRLRKSQHCSQLRLRRHI